jgi:hypothetical protein
MRTIRCVADDPCMTLGTELRHLDDIAAGLRAMASHAVAYDDETVLWLAGSDRAGG